MRAPSRLKHPSLARALEERAAYTAARRRDSPSNYATQRQAAYAAPKAPTRYATMEMRGLGYVSPETQPWWQIIEPSVVLAKMRELDTQNRTINMAFNVDTGVGAGAIADALGTPFVAAWASYYGEWVLFFGENQGWLDRFSSATGDQLVSLINRSNSFEERLRAVHIDPGTQTPEEVGGRERGLPAWGWGLIAIGAITASGVALWGISRVLGESRALIGPLR